ncbi:L-threonylcarbamoyladenylate synthase [Candidatus Roseilinea sp. NK_OTU-006]|uniref:L-threonylcarbamoyladenylate synthase n=1 Tax=Candidatus Roseilinea sp. NK_OTU-006 TaxID=2704250 RepID=UPI002A5A9721|nr:L-threonylcarbamoyladenylate synthase [Candidatus Roseilinea sp. NK_OTU-006]
MSDAGSAEGRAAIREAARVIRDGGLVAFPTETVYGLGANALDARAVARIFEAKQRPLNDPLILHIASLDDLTDLTSATAQSDATALGSLVAGLTRAFWPGPLTLVLPRSRNVPPIVSAGLDTVAVRMPDHPVAQALIHASGVPIAAPSANRFGHVSPTTAQHVLDDLNGRIDLVLDSHATSIGVESTVLDLTTAPPRILRPGGVTREQIEHALANIGQRLAPDDPQLLPRIPRNMPLPSPGMLPSHYAPRAQLALCRDTDSLLAQRANFAARGLKTGLLILESQRQACANLHPQFVLGETLSDIARNLYAGLRALDSAGVDVILVTEVPRSGLGEAIADRLARAAAKAVETEANRDHD